MKADEECCLPFLERAVRRGAEGERLCGTAFRLAREARRVPLKALQITTTARRVPGGRWE